MKRLRYSHVAKAKRPSRLKEEATSTKRKKSQTSIVRKPIARRFTPDPALRTGRAETGRVEEAEEAVVAGMVGAGDAGVVGRVETAGRAPAAVEIAETAS